MSKIALYMIIFGVLHQFIAFMYTTNELYLLYTSIVGVIWMVGGIVLNEVVKEIKERDENDRSF